MRRSTGIVPIIAILFVACVAAVWLWYRGTPASTPSARPSAQPTAVTYVPVQQPVVKATPSPARTAPARATAPARTAAPPSAAPRPSAAQTAARATPSPTATPGALNAGATPGPTQIPVEAATIAPGHLAPPVIREDPNAPPRILAMSLSTPVAHSGQTVFGTVETTSNVASVEARVAGYSSTMEKVGVGKFRMTYTVPRLPFFLKRTWNIEVIARNSRGDAVSSSIPITIR